MEITRPIEYIVIHTFGYDGIAGFEEVHSWHKNRGWNGCGYNEIIRRDGTTEPGRNPNDTPAHCRGINRISYGISMEGNGDKADFTSEQKHTLVERIISVSKRCKTRKEICLYCTIKKNLMRVIGHKEVNVLVKVFAWLTSKYKTSKTCPGTKVSCSEIRRMVSKAL
jgi:hypothetical protein